jgi:hypothetical protein
VPDLMAIFAGMDRNGRRSIGRPADRARVLFVHSANEAFLNRSGERAGGSPLPSNVPSLKFDLRPPAASEHA